jgi:hypothetical protein
MKTDLSGHIRAFRAFRKREISKVTVVQHNKYMWLTWVSLK